MKKSIAVLTMLMMITVSLLSASAAAGAPVSTDAGEVQTGTVGAPVIQELISQLHTQAPVDEPAADDAQPAQETPAADNAQPAQETAADDAQQDSDQQPSSSGETVLAWDNYTAQLLRYKINKFEHSDAALYLYMRIINHTDRTMTLKLDNVTVDGVSVKGAGIYGTKPGTDTGENSAEYCLLIPDPDNAQSGSQALVQASEVNTVLILKDSESQEELFRQDVTIHLKNVDSERNVYEHTSAQSEPETAASHVDVSVSNEQPGANYRSLSLWGKGEDVKKLQERLIELGYLDDKADGSFGPNTAEAVKEFNEANGLTGGQTADAATQELIFSDRAAAYTEPQIPLKIGPQFEVEAEPEENSFFFRVQATNISRDKTIRGYELEVYITDVWDKKLSEDTQIQTMTQKIGPGETVQSGSFYLADYNAADTVWVRITKVVFTDGEVRENEVSEFYPCELPSHITQ